MLTFCIRDDDTNYFTTPEVLESAYSALWDEGPISLSVVPFHKGCRTKGIPSEYWNTGEVYPLEDNRDLVRYLRKQIKKNRIEVMLHGYHHEDFSQGPEFFAGTDLVSKALEGKKYLERLFEKQVRVFVPPHNSISRYGLKAIISSGMQLGCLAGLRNAWPLHSLRSWRNWWRIKCWERKYQLSYPWIVDMLDHREVVAHAVTPSSNIGNLIKELRQAEQFNATICLATHYWEYDDPHNNTNSPNVREQIYSLVKKINSLSSVRWITMGDLLFLK